MKVSLPDALRQNGCGCTLSLSLSLSRGTSWHEHGTILWCASSLEQGKTTYICSEMPMQNQWANAKAKLWHKQWETKLHLWLELVCCLVFGGLWLLWLLLLMCIVMVVDVVVLAPTPYPMATNRKRYYSRIYGLQSCEVIMTYLLLKHYKFLQSTKPRQCMMLPKESYSILATNYNTGTIIDNISKLDLDRAEYTRYGGMTLRIRYLHDTPFFFEAAAGQYPLRAIETK